MMTTSTRIEMNGIESELQIKTRQLQIINEALAAYLRTSSWQQAAQCLVRGALEETESEHGLAGVLGEGGLLRILADVGFDWPNLEETGCIECSALDDVFAQAISGGNACLSARCLGVPVLKEGRVIGIIGVRNRPKGYTLAQQERLEFLAETAGILFDGFQRLQREETLREQLRQAQKMEAIGRLAGGIAHDFNNVLTVIKGYSQVIAESGISEDIAGWVNEIQRAANRASALTRQLLTFSRKQVVQPRVFNVNELIARMEPMIQRLIGEHIELKSSCHAVRAVVEADPSQIELLMMNLAINARDAMPGGGRLSIRTSMLECSQKDVLHLPPGNFIVISVSDTGCGMDPLIIPQIFEPFFTTKEVGKGTGLGLSTVYGIVEQSGGRINVQTKPGRGTTFNVFLPLTNDSPATDERPASGPVTAVSSTTILLVEDDEMVRELAGMALRRKGYRVLEASNRNEAVDHCRRFDGPIHVVLSDIVMPGTNGPETVIQLKAIRPGMKTLFMSGYIEDTLSQYGIEESETAFISKPFTADLLMEKIAEVLGTRDTILVVDDDEGVLQFVTKTLELAGYRAVTATNGVDALRLLEDVRCALLITDLMMPAKDGIDLAIEVQRKYPAMPVVAMSGIASLKAVSFASQLHNVSSLEKPFGRDELLSLVGQLVGL